MSGQQRVVLDASSFIKGWLIATTLWVGVMLIVALFVFGVPPVLGGTDVAHLLGAGLSLAFYGYGIALVFAAPLAWVLAYLLRPVIQQWIHIAAFFVVPTLAFWAVAGLLGFGWHPGWLGLWATVGAASAIGRWSIRKDASLSEAEDQTRLRLDGAGQELQLICADKSLLVCPGRSRRVKVVPGGSRRWVGTIAWSLLVLAFMALLCSATG